MSATKILWGQILTVFLIVLMTTWGATQYVAWSLGFQAQLGQAWFEFAGWPIYYPPAIFWWWYFYEAYAPNIFAEGGLIAASGGFIAIAVAIGMSVWRAREAKHAATYGSARWADKTEIKAAGLLGADGVVLGRFHQEYLRHDGPEHVLCFAPTRSGKGVGLVIPSLLTWPGSAIVHDIKGENWQLTSGFRAQHGRALLFDPTNPKSSAYNPLLEVRRGEWEVRDVQNIADILVDPEGSLDKRNHWEKTSHSLLVGAILHVLYAEPDKTLAGVAKFLSDRHGLPVHLDGARLFNAGACLNVPISAICTYATSAWFAVCKGLGGPVGAVLTGDAEFMARARRAAKMLGGGMRQAGLIAAPALVALRDPYPQHHRDHVLARSLAEGLAGIDGSLVEVERVQTNIVNCYVDRFASSAAAINRSLREQGVLANAKGTKIRFVTHYHIDEQAIAAAVAAMAGALAEQRRVA